MAEGVKDYNEFKDKKIAQQDKKGLEDKFKKDVPYWQRLNWQVQDDIWNDIRMNSKYGFQLFQRFLKENKDLVIQANGNGIDIVKEFQIHFTAFVELFTFSKQQQIKKAVILELSKQLEFCPLKFDSILFSALKRSFSGEPLTIDYKLKSELITIQKTGEENIYSNQVNLSLIQSVEKEKQNNKSSKQIENTKSFQVVRNLLNYLLNILSLNRDSNKNSKINSQQNNINISQIVKQQHQSTQPTNPSNDIDKISSQQSQKQYSIQQNSEGFQNIIKNQKYQKKISQVISQQTNKIKKFCLIKQSHIDIHSIQKNFKTLFSEKQQRVKLNKVFKIDCNFNGYKKKLLSQMKQHKYLIIQVDLANDNSQKYVKHILQLLFDLFFQKNISEQQKQDKIYRHAFFLLLKNLQNSTNNLQKINQNNTQIQTDIYSQLENIITLKGQDCLRMNHQIIQNRYSQVFQLIQQFLLQQ